MANPPPLPPGPPEKPTVQLPKVPDWAVELILSVKSGFRGVDERLDTLETNLDIQGNTVRDVAKRMTALEERVVGIESRQHATSIRARQSTDNDLKHDAAIGVIISDVNELKASQAVQLAILEKWQASASKIAANPIVRSIATMVGAAVLTWLASHGGVK
jgi:hypothetical protein